MSALVFALVAACGNLLGGWAVVRHERRGLAVIELFLAFGAGFMIAVTLLEVAPEALARRTDAPIFILLGYLAVHLAQHVLVPHFHFGEETHKVSRRQGLSALIGLLLHTFFDGVAIASGFQVSPHLGLLLPEEPDDANHRGSSEPGRRSREAGHSARRGDRRRHVPARVSSARRLHLRRPAGAP